MEVRRGDIVRVDLNPTKGSEQRGAGRPCVVIQNDVGNRFSPTTIVAPFTIQYDSDHLYPFEVEILAEHSALDRNSVADLSQIRVVDTEMGIAETLGSFPEAKVDEIDAAIKASLGL